MWLHQQQCMPQPIGDVLLLLLLLLLLLAELELVLVLGTTDAGCS